MVSNDPQPGSSFDPLPSIACYHPAAVLRRRSLCALKGFSVFYFVQFWRCNCEPPPKEPCNPLCVTLHVDQSDFFPPAAGQNSVTALSLDEQKSSAEKLSVLFLLLWKWESAAHFCHNCCSSDTNQQQICPQRPGRSLLCLPLPRQCAALAAHFVS